MSMLPKSISFQNYRSFTGRHEFNLKPLTLIYGPNNVGKSALVRLLPLLGDSVAADATGALRLESPAGFGAGFSDLESKWAPTSDLPEPAELGLTLCWQESVREAGFIFEQRDREGVVIRELDILLADGTSDHFTRVPIWDANEPFVHEYDLAGTPSRRIKVSFRGLVPADFPNDIISLASLRESLLSLRGSVQWLRAQRAIPDRRLARPSGPLRSLKPDGSDAAAALFGDRELTDEVSAWYRSAFRRALILRPDPPDEFRCQLENTAHTVNAQIDLVDSGNGPGQVLPVIVACALAARAREPRIVPLEEPDANLDAPTQRQLAEYLVQTAAAPSQPRLIVETHSEALLLGVQLAIAKGDCDLAPEDVAIYWVEQDDAAKSRISTVAIDAEGRLSGNWPDPFGQLRALARELVSIRMQRSVE